MIRSYLISNRPLPAGAGGTNHELDNFRSLLKSGMARFRDYALIITRAELAGVKPEKLLDPDVPNPAMLLAALISELQAKSPKVPGRMDPLLVSAYINASLFAFATLSPWLMTSGGIEDVKGVVI